MKKSIRKATMALGVAAMLVGVAGQASAASYKGISVMPTLHEGDYAKNGVVFAIKNDNDGWNTVSDVRVQKQLADGTWDYVGYAKFVQLAPEQKEYIELPPEAFTEDGIYRYETQTTRIETGYNLGTFTSESFRIYGNYVPPIEPTDTMTPEQIEEQQTAAGEYQQEQWAAEREQAAIDNWASNWDLIMQDRYN